MKKQGGLLNFLAKENENLFSDGKKSTSSKKRSRKEIAETNNSQEPKKDSDPSMSKPNKRQSSKKQQKNSKDSQPSKRILKSSKSSSELPCESPKSKEIEQKKPLNGKKAGKSSTARRSKKEEGSKTSLFDNNHEETKSLERHPSFHDNSKTKEKRDFGLNDASLLPTQTKGSEESSQQLTIENCDVENLNEFEMSIPSFARPENVRDANKNSPSDPDYDPSTLYIPPEFFSQKGITPSQKQYWILKAKNFDSILLFQYGNFYEIYSNDAVICHQLLGLNWVGIRLQVGIPLQSFDFHVQKLVDAGYKVAVVDQLETPKQMEERVKNTKGNKKDARLIRRDAVQILSKGTFAGKTYASAESRYLMAICHTKDTSTKCNTIGVVFVDITTNKINLGFISDDEHLTQFKTLIYQIRPVEIVYSSRDFDPHIKSVLSNSSISPIFSALNNPKNWNIFEGLGELCKHFGIDEKNWPEAVQELQKSDQKRYELVMMAFSGITTYLRKLLISDRVIKPGKFVVYDPVSFSQTNMVLDSQALHHLEILRVEYNPANPSEGSLFSLINHTCTNYGARMLKRWLCAPLLDVVAINDRLDAIEDLHNIENFGEEFCTGMRKIPDLERLLTRIYNYGVKQAERVIIFEEVSLVRLRDYQMTMNYITTARSHLVKLAVHREDFKSQLLKNLTNLRDISSLDSEQLIDPTIVPDPLELLNQFNNLISWEGDENSSYKLAIPRPGIDLEYDRIKKEIEAIHKGFESYLVGIRERFLNNKINYSNAKYRYELEIPIHLVEGKKKPSDFEFTSQKKNFQRFHTKEIKDMLLTLEEKEEELKQCLALFITSIFEKFGHHAIVWDRFVSVLAHIDSLLSLSIFSFKTDTKTRPVLYPMTDKPFFVAKSIRHPCLCDKGTNFIPNDIYLGGHDLLENDIESDDKIEELSGSNKKLIIFLTGPNMGGKSTILRQTCVTAILAQIGCYLPALEVHMTIVDRIFTRIGSSDSLIEGKSTFYIEMEETLSALKDATCNSLIIMDELGRGTSTFDGFAIAYAVLKHLLEVKKCRALFATHYHALIDEFEEDYQNLGFYFMDWLYNAVTGKIVFKYKFLKGICPQSFGLKVAELADLPEQSIERAKQKTIEFEENINLKENIVFNKKFKNAIKYLSLTE